MFGGGGGLGGGFGLGGGLGVFGHSEFCLGEGGGEGGGEVVKRRGQNVWKIDGNIEIFLELVHYFQDNLTAIDTLERYNTTNKQLRSLNQDLREG